MAEYIDRETVELKLHGKCEFCKKRDTCCSRFGSHYYCWEFDDVLFHVADVQEVKHGKWIEKEEDLGYDVYQCSVCKEEYCLETGSPQENNYDYCPNCGARMD